MDTDHYFSTVVNASKQRR